MDNGRHCGRVRYFIYCDASPVNMIYDNPDNFLRSLMPKKLLASAILLLIIFYSFSVNAQQGLDNIQNPKANGGGYVSNADHVISDATVNQLNSMIKPLDQQGKAQVAVVLVKSIGGQVPKDFATALFRKWGIGDRTRNNGLLILLVMDQRRMEFEVGYGLEGLLTDLTSQRIQKGLMIPYFKKGDYDTGILKGVGLVVSTIDTGVDQSLDKDNMYPEIGYVVFQDILFFIVYLIIFCWFTLSARGQYVTHSTSWLWLPFLLFGPLATVAFLGLATPVIVQWDLFFLITYCCWSLFFSFTLSKMLKSDPIGGTRVQQYQHLKLVIGGITIYTILFPLPFLVINYFAAKRRLNRLRYSPYQSPNGNGAMILVKENRAAELNDKEQAEEQLGSVSYDLWKSEKGGDVLKLAYKDQNTKIRRCKKCRSFTSKRTKRVVEKRATTKGGGMTSIYYTCVVCGKNDFINESTSRKKKFNFFKGMGAAAASSGGGSGSSSSDSSGDSGSSSSSSSDWGGGSSGGGGSGSSW